MSSPIPTAKPRAGRLFGVGVTPRNAVMSANARVGVRSATKRRGATRGIRFIGRVYAKAPRFAGSRFGGSKIRAPKRDGNAPMPNRAAPWLWRGGSAGAATPRGREPANPRTADYDKVIAHGFPPQRRPGSPAQERAGVRRSGDSSARDGMGRG